MNRLFYILIFLNTCLVPLKLIAGQQPHFNVRQFQLPIKTRINDITEDQYGFVWLGTLNGLWRWDGGNFKEYKKNVHDKTGITDNHITCVFEDSKGILWVGTYGGGLLKYDRECDCFQRFLHDDKDPKSLSFNEVKTLYESSDNTFYIGTDGGGLNILDREHETFTHFKHDPNNANSLSHNNVLSITEGKDGIMYIGTWKGLNILDTSNFSLTQVFHDYVPHYQAHFHLSFHNDVLLSLSYPLSKLNQQNKLERIKKINHIDSHKHWPNRSITNVSNYLWLTDKNEVRVYDEKLNLITKIPSFKFSKKDNQHLHKVTRGKKANEFWAIGDKGNFFHIDQKPRIFAPILTDIPLEKIIVTDRYYWATYEKYVYVFDKYTNKEIKKIDFPFKELLIDKRNNNEVYIVDYVSLYKYEENGNLIWKKKHHSAFSSSIEVTKDENIWLGKILGAVQFNPNTDQLKKFECDPNNDKGIGYFHRTTAILESSTNDVWIGTIADGLKKYNPTKNTFDHYRHVIGDSTTISSNFINTITEDFDGNLWLGTKTGVCQFNPTKKTFSLVDTKPLNELKVSCILQDLQANLWVGTVNGLFRIDAKTGGVRALNVQDGLRGNEITGGLRLKGGGMVFLTDAGPMFFNPKKVHPSLEEPSVYFSNLWINNELIRPGAKQLQKNIEIAERIKLNPNDFKFELEFRAIHHDNNKRCKYKYKLEGFDKDWILTEGSSKATYTNIPPGNYIFKVKATNDDGIWTAKSKEIPIEITPSFWERLWVRILLATILGIIGFLIFRYILNRQKKKAEFIIEKSKVEQAEEIMKMKLRFFTNISHELRTPLTLINAPLDKYNIDKTPPKKGVLEMMHRNSKRLLELVNQILDFRKLEGNQQSLNAKEHKNLILFQHIESAYSYWSTDKNIDFKISYPEVLNPIYFDADIVEKIITNLISNAFKFTPESGSIQLNIHFSDLEIKNNKTANGRMLIELKDNGPGIPKENQHKIFDRFYQLDDDSLSAKGSGIGLSLTSELVSLHKGTITLDSDVGKGTLFLIEIPIGYTSYNLLTSQVNHHIYPEINPERTVILVVEDNDDIRNYLVQELGENYEVLEANNGKNGLQIAFTSIPDIIISDIMMPEMDGIQLANQIKNNELTAHIPLLFLTAKGSTQDKLAGLATGAEDYIQKPFNIVEVKLKVKNLLDTRSALAKKYQDSKITVEAKNETPSYLLKVNEVLVDHLSNSQFSVEVLCSELGVGRSQLYRKILALTGKSIIEYINSYRLSKALELIQEGQHSIKEIAFMVGYNDNHYFSRSFKKEYGKPPSSFSPKKRK